MKRARLEPLRKRDGPWPPSLLQICEQIEGALAHCRHEEARGTKKLIRLCEGTSTKWMNRSFVDDIFMDGWSPSESEKSAHWLGGSVRATRGSLSAISSSLA